jgi:hypothetical protein
MSINLDQVLVKKFESEAIQAFQDSGAGLRNTVRVRDAKGAQSVQFQVLGKMTSAERGAIHTDIPLQDVSHTPKVATVKNYVVSEMTDIFLNNQVGFDERQELVTSVAMALNRRLDQVILDALGAASITKTVAANISGTSDNLNVAMFAETARLLGSDVPDVDRHFLCHDDGFYHFLQEKEVASMEYNLNKALAEGKVPAYLGLNIHKMGDRLEGGLPLSSTNRTNYAWQKLAIGLAVNMEPKITIDWEPSKGAHRVTGYLSAGAVVIQESGTVKITSSEAA